MPKIDPQHASESSKKIDHLISTVVTFSWLEGKTHITENQEQLKIRVKKGTNLELKKKTLFCKVNNLYEGKTKINRF